MNRVMNPTLPSGAAESTARAGWIFYDGECVLCQGLVRRWGGPLRRLGYEPVPLQTPGTPERVGLTPEELRQRMVLLTVDSRRFCGADAYVEMARARWWSAPLAWLAHIPGMLPLMRRAYDWIARHRHCAAGACRVALRPTRRARHRTRPFLDLP